MEFYRQLFFQFCYGLELFFAKNQSRLALHFLGLYKIYLEGLTMNFKKILDNKKQYLDLLLLADEQEDMIDKYLERGEMYVLDDNGIKAECVITKESDNIYE